MIIFEQEAREIRAAIDNGTPPAETGDTSRLNTLEGARQRAYAIAAVFGDMTLNHLVGYRQNLPPFGLEHHRQNPDGSWTDETEVVRELDSWEDLSFAMGATMRGAQGDLFEKLERNRNFSQWYDHTANMLSRMSGAVSGGNYDSPEEFLRGGLGTAVDVSVRTLDLVNRAHMKYAPDASNDEIIATARQAKKIPFRLAHTLPLERVVQGIEVLGGVSWREHFRRANSFDIDRFEITPSSSNSNILKIRYSEEALSDPRDHTSLATIETTLVHLKCPGLADLSRLEDPYSHSVDRVYSLLTHAASDLCLWRSENSLPGDRFVGI